MKNKYDNYDIPDRYVNWLEERFLRIISEPVWDEDSDNYNIQFVITNEFDESVGIWRYNVSPYFNDINDLLNWLKLIIDGIY